MVVVIASKSDTVSTIGPVTPTVETTIIEYDGAAFDFIVEGYVDISALQNGAPDDTLVITEYIAVDGSNFQIYKQTTYTGVQAEPSVRFHAKTFPASFLYKVTVNQTLGTGRSFPIGFIQEVFNS